MKQSLLANNIWTLRTAFGETQLDLALALGLNSSNTISNYESGSRKPNNKIIIKLSKHYNITEYELCNTNLSDYLEAKNLLHSDLGYFEKIARKYCYLYIPFFIKRNLRKTKFFTVRIKDIVKL